MILRVWWRQEGRAKPEEIQVAAAWPYGEWLAYRCPGSQGVTHYIPGSAVWQIEVEERPYDPDPMRARTPGPDAARPILTGPGT